jgi:hypothetical protein
MNPMNERLSGDFWFSLFMATLCLGGAIFGWRSGNGYAASVGGFLAALYVFRVWKNVEKAKLAKVLNRHPELRRIYESTPRND